MGAPTPRYTSSFVAVASKTLSTRNSRRDEIAAVGLDTVTRRSSRFVVAAAVKVEACGGRMRAKTRTRSSSAAAGIRPECASLCRGPFFSGTSDKCQKKARKRT
eukprot:30957-Pelagococcus_subviridis.AAC.30